MIEETIELSVGDGVHLATDVRLPEAEGRWPTLLMRTPYLRTNEFLPMRPSVERPYAMVLQDVRGRHGSSGLFDLGASDRRDGAETVEWIAKQPWSDGRISMHGISYAGHTQLQAARAHPSGLRSIAPIRCPAWWRPLTMHEGGALMLALAAHWLPLQALEARDCPDDARAPLARIALSFEQVVDYPWGPPTANGALNAGRALGHEGLTRRPLRDRPEFDPLPTYAAMWRHLFDGPFTTSWIDDAGPEAGDEPACDVLLLGGWYDCWAKDTVEMFSALRARRPEKRHHLVMTPFSHAPEPAGQLALGSDAGRFDDWYSISWTEALLGMKGSPADLAPVTYFSINDNRWHESDSWPPAGVVARTLFLNAGHDRTDGTLSDTPADSGRVGFVYDPRDPVLSMGGAQLGLPAGPMEQSSVDSHHRPDVCSFTGEYLDRDWTLAGPVTARIHLHSDAPDTDVVVKLIDVFPDGRAFNIVDGIRRARFRHTDGLPRLLHGGVEAYDVHLWDIAYTVRAGHRLRVDVTSSSFPKFEPNANSGRPLG
ncbi:MAG: CocE/NonD family hydrolase, partial [Candidatus Dormibacteria bacterium]